MPKKQTRRPTRSRSPQRRAVQRPAQPGQPSVPEAAPAAGVATATTARPVEPAPAASAAPRRGSTSRRVTALTINYTYLRRDIRALLILAPSMVVLVVVAYFLFH